MVDLTASSSLARLFGVSPPLLERAVTIRREKGAAATLLATSRFALGCALWDAGRDRKQALLHARSARDVLATAGEAFRQDTAEVAEWLAEHDK